MIKLLVVAATIFAFTASWANADQLTPIKFGSTKLGAMTSIWVAIQAGIFKRHGLDVQFTQIPLSDQSVPFWSRKRLTSSI